MATGSIRAALAALALIGIAGCGESTVPGLDSGATDASALDAASDAAGPFDAATDAGPDDAGPPASDAGADDAGVLERDAGEVLSCPFDAALETATADELARQGIAGVTLGIDMPGCGWRGAAGVADRASGRAMVVDDGFRIASVTKTFTAAVVLQLVEEGRLELGDALTSYVAFPGAAAVTIRHLLAHTSGIYDYYNSPGVLSELGRAWTREEVVDVARAQPLAFAPGSDEDYSNTNYFLLGMVIEAVTGNPYHVEVRARLLTPLGLSHTYVAGVETSRGDLARGYDRASGGFDDVTDLVDPSLTWAAGGIVSSTPDLMVWTRELFAGDVLGPAMRTALTTREPLPGGRLAPHGLGVQVQVLPRGLGLFYSHLGRLQGYYGMMGYLVDHDAVMVQQTDDTDGGPNPFMTEMWMVVGLI